MQQLQQSSSASWRHHLPLDGLASSQPSRVKCEATVCFICSQICWQVDTLGRYGRCRSKLDFEILSQALLELRPACSPGYFGPPKNRRCAACEISTGDLVQIGTRHSSQSKWLPNRYPSSSLSILWGNSGVGQLLIVWDKLVSAGSLRNCQRLLSHIQSSGITPYYNSDCAIESECI